MSASVTVTVVMIQPQILVINCEMNSVCYCCVWKEKEGRVVYKYTIGNHEIDTMAALCLEMIPPFHRFYFETIPPFTFAFFFDHAFVYFAILRHSRLPNSHLLSFLHKFRDAFTRTADSHDQFLPVVRRLVASLELVPPTPTAWPAMSNANGDVETGSSTKAPLLARLNKHDKKKMKDDHAVEVASVQREMEMEENRRGSTDDSSNGHGTPASRIKSNNARDKWCRQVRIVLAIDAAVCLLLFIIWLVICHGIECIRSD